MIKATYTITDEELRESMRRFKELESREKRTPWLLKWFMGRGRPKYSWQVWLSNHWPTKEIPKKRRLSTLMANEMSKAIDTEILKEIHKKILEKQNDKPTNQD